MKRLLLLAVFAASPLFAQEVRLDAVLHGGRDALISVDALPPGAEEWEAFLSADGGAHYAVRITPHLDASIRAFRFRVPNVSTHDARIILRTGDEVHERIFAIPRSFTIEAGYMRLDLGAATVSTEAFGESARFDDDHVVEWCDAGREMRHRDDNAIDDIARLTDETTDIVAPTGAYAPVAPPRLIARVATVCRARGTFRAVTRDSLLLSTRLNI